MNAKRINSLAGMILGGTLLLGTAGVVAAQSPNGTTSPSATSGMAGSMGTGGMMGGGQGMMNGAGMMNGMDAGHIATMRKAMGANVNCDPALMQTMHRQGTQGH